MVLNADSEFERRKQENSERRAAFKLHSGVAVKEFVAMWEMFDHREEFDLCISELVEKALAIREDTYFSRIVTTTPTGRELGRHVYNSIQEFDNTTPLSLYHFGEYPVTPLIAKTDNDFEHQQVLILTDVISTGSLIRNMSDIVYKGNGKVVAALSVVLTNPFKSTERQFNRAAPLKLINNISQDEITNEKEPPQVHLVSGSQQCKVHFLTYLPIDRISPDDYDEDKLIPIDYSSVLPEVHHGGPSAFKALFTLPETIKHLEEAGALNVGFYSTDDRRYTCSFNIQKLLKDNRDRIWRSIWNKFSVSVQKTHAPAPVHLVTTYQRHDLLFKNFIEDGLKREGISTTTSITLKRGVKDETRLNITLGNGSEKIKGHSVTVVLATISTTEKLRSIVSVLLENGASEIRVLCLFNRTGVYTAGFFSQISQFLNRSQITSKPTAFTFDAVYSFLDVDNGDIRRMHQAITWIMTQYKLITKPKPLSGLADRFTAFFEPVVIGLDKNESQPIELLPHPYKLPEKPGRHILKDQLNQVKARTEAGRIATQTINLALNRDFTPIVNSTRVTHQTRQLSHYYGLFLSDIAYLRFTPTLKSLWSVLVNRLDELRIKRFDLEQNYPHEDELNDLYTNIHDIVELEAMVLFGLGIVSRYISYEEGMPTSGQELIFCNVSNQLWTETFSHNMIVYFTNENLIFALSFLIKGIFPDLTTSYSPRSQRVLKDLRDTIRNFRIAFDEIRDSLFDSSNSSKANMIVNNLDHLLSDFGSYDVIEKHATIRFLQREVIKPAEGHSPILSTLGALKSDMDLYFQQTDTSPPHEDYTHPQAYHKHRLDDKLKDSINDAINGTSSLPSIAENAHQYFQSVLTQYSERRRYTELTDQDSFASDVDNLISTLRRIQNDKQFSFLDYHVIKTAYYAFKDDFLSDDSTLRKSLLQHIIPLDLFAERGINRAYEDLKAQNYSVDVLKQIVTDLRKRRLAALDHRIMLLEKKRGTSESELRGHLKNTFGNYLVLGEPRFVIQLIRNLVNNLQHAFPDPSNFENRLDVANIKIDVNSGDSPISLQGQKLPTIEFYLKVTNVDQVPSDSHFDDSDNTIYHQTNWLKGFGMEIELESVPSSDLQTGAWYSQKLRFLSRNEFTKQLYPELF